MITDWISAIVPCLIVRKLQMRRRVKISVMFILGIGGLASIAVTIRCFYFKYYDKVAYPNNFLCKSKYTELKLRHHGAKERFSRTN